MPSGSVGRWLGAALAFSDRHGDGSRPLLAPAGQARRPAPRAPARAHEEQIVGVLEDVAPRRLVGGRDGPGQARGALEVGHGPTGALDQELLDVAPAPAALL